MGEPRPPIYGNLVPTHRSLLESTLPRRSGLLLLHHCRSSRFTYFPSCGTPSQLFDTQLTSMAHDLAMKLVTGNKDKICRDLSV